MAMAETACNANDALTKGVGCHGRAGSELRADISYHSKEFALDCRDLVRQNGGCIDHLQTLVSGMIQMASSLSDLS